MCSSCVFFFLNFSSALRGLLGWHFIRLPSKSATGCILLECFSSWQLFIKEGALATEAFIQKAVLSFATLVRNGTCIPLETKDLFRKGKLDGSQPASTWNEKTGDHTQYHSFKFCLPFYRKRTFWVQGQSAILTVSIIIYFYEKYLWWSNPRPWRMAMKTQ